MGYSCSDIWDVQPCMKSVPLPHADIFYIKHTEDGSIIEGRLESWPTEEFTEYQGYEINGETTHILRTICEYFRIPVTARRKGDKELLPQRAA